MTRVMANERISQILPTVKCSDCGEDVQIRKLGEHVCSNMPAIPPLPIIPPRQADKKSPQPKSPSPSLSSSKASSSIDYDNNPVTPPYYHGLPRNNDPWDDDNRPLVNTSYGQTSPKTPTFLHSPPDRPRKNSTSPAPPSPRMMRSPSPWQQSSPRDFDHGRSAKSSHDNNKPGGALDTFMADLMNSFNDNRPDDRNNRSDSCAVCHEDFDYRDDVVNHDNAYYHRECFTCRLCRAPFDPARGGRPCYEYNGKLYCERDYNVVRKRIMCAGCERPITSNTTPIKVLGQHYHPGHIKCYHCYEPITEATGHKEHQGRVYCRADFKALFLPTCRACGKPVEREAVSAMDGKLEGKWHLDCFGCHTCHRPFPDNTFYVFDNAPYCKRHYHQLNNSLCRTCDEPIEGPCAQTIEGWRFHPACFRCNVCRCAITDVYYMYERRIYCETHIRQLQGQRNIRAEKRKTQFGRI